MTKPPDSAAPLLHVENLDVSADGHALLRGVGFSLERGGRLGMVGPSGCGKTTLLRTISGEHPALSGSCSPGHRVKIATYRQRQEGLHSRQTVLDAVMARSSLTIGEARGLLGRFLFSGSEVDKKTEALSGGERSRVALALLSLMDGNMLFLDEPTNHLDLASQEILEEALDSYDGTILLVSHDRALLEAITTQVWLVEGGRMSVHTYGYAEYRRRQAEAARQSVHAERTAPQPRPTPQTRRQKTATGPKRDKYAQAAHDARMLELETAIEHLETKRKEIESDLQDASERGDGQRIAKLSSEYKAVGERLETEYATWEQAAGEHP